MSAPTSDRGGIQQTIRALKAGGWELDYVNWGNDDVPVSNEAQAVKEIMSVDMAWLYVKKGDETGWVFFVLGNDPREVINDSTVNLLEAIDPMTNEWYQA